MEADQIFLETTVKLIVDHPEDVIITRVRDDMGILMTLTVNPLDMGKIIGRQGGNAQAIRTLVRTIGMKNQAKVNLKITDPRDRSNVQSAYDEASEL